jgi:hypothetical protein
MRRESEREGHCDVVENLPEDITQSLRMLSRSSELRASSFRPPNVELEA